MQNDESIVISQDMSPAVMNNAFQGILKSPLVSIKKIGIKELQLFTKAKDVDDMVSSIREVLKKDDTENVLALWHSCKKGLQHDIILLSDTEVDMELMKKFDLRGDFVSKAFLSRNNFPFPQISPYTVHLGALEPIVAENLTYLLKSIPKDYAKECVTALGMQVLYLLCIKEIEAYVSDAGYSLKQWHEFLEPEINQDPEDMDLQKSFEEGGDFFAAISSGLSVPMDMPFTAWMQAEMQDLFKMVMYELHNPTWPELREMFYELYRRNKNSAEEDKDESI